MLRRMLLLLALSVCAASAADISGTWDFTVSSDAGTSNPVFTFEQKGDKLTGTYKGMLGEAKVAGTVTGDKVSFTLEAEFGGEKLRIDYSGVVESATAMKGKVTIAALGEGSWTAKKR